MSNNKKPVKPVDKINKRITEDKKPSLEHYVPSIFDTLKPLHPIKPKDKDNDNDNDR